eukprot:m51a1_g5541 hypothetical protein (290) ;mRNA; r:481376-482245
MDTSSLQRRFDSLVGTADPRNSHDSTVLVLHCAALERGLRFVGVEVPSGVPATAASADALPASWNARGGDVYAFRYEIPGAGAVVVKHVALCRALASHAVVVALPGSQVASHVIRNVDVATSDVAAVAREFSDNVIDKILAISRGSGIPGSGSSSSSARDVFVFAPAREPGGGASSQPPLGPRFDDLTPVGGELFGTRGRGEGLLVGPHSSLFGGGPVDPTRAPPGSGLPPQSRWDPLGPIPPSGARFGGRGRGAGGLGGIGGGQAPRQPFGEPDPDHMPPPGYGDMFM